MMVIGGGCGLVAMRRRRRIMAMGGSRCIVAVACLGGAGGFECFRLENQRLGGEVVHHAHGKTGDETDKDDEKSWI